MVGEGSDVLGHEGEGAGGCPRRGLPQDGHHTHAEGTAVKPLRGAGTHDCPQPAVVVQFGHHRHHQQHQQVGQETGDTPWGGGVESVEGPGEARPLQQRSELRAEGVLGVGVRVGDRVRGQGMVFHVIQQRTVKKKGIKYKRIKNLNWIKKFK